MYKILANYNLIIWFIYASSTIFLAYKLSGRYFPPYPPIVFHDKNLNLL